MMVVVVTMMVVVVVMMLLLRITNRGIKSRFSRHYTYITN